MNDDPNTYAPPPSSPPSHSGPYWVSTVRYGKMAFTGLFKTDREELVKRLDRCVIRTDRGKEYGTVLTVLSPLPANQSADGYFDIIRKATPEDLKNSERIDKEARVKAIGFCKEEVKKLNLQMKVVECDYVMGGERVVFYFTSGTRIDFRDLVRHLARDLRTRIELKQVGARDEARLVGDCGHCGLTLCCRGHLKELGGITMDMAKVQKHTADPAKITGRCGKLLCCLRYEYTAYAEARDLMPARGTRIDIKRVKGFVIEQNLLLREVTVIRENSEERVVVKLDEFENLPKPVAGCDGCASPKAQGGTGPVEGAAGPSPEPKAEPTAIPPAESPAASPAEWVKVCRTSDVGEGKAKQIDVAGRGVAVYRLFGKFYATQGECPHRQGPLGEGRVDGTTIQCPLHNWKFDLTTGAWHSNPEKKLKTYETKVETDDLFVRL